MAPTDAPNASLDPGFFGNRLLLEIDQWECTYHLGLSSELIPPEYRFQGGLAFSQGFELNGRVIAPAKRREEQFRVWLSPFGTDRKFGPDGLDEVGRVHFLPQKGITAGSAITLFIPEATMATVETCLATLWKYLHIMTFDEGADEASVRAFSLTKDIHKNLMPWVSGDRT